MKKLLFCSLISCVLSVSAFATSASTNSSDHCTTVGLTAFDKCMAKPSLHNTVCQRVADQAKMQCSIDVT